MTFDPPCETCLERGRERAGIHPVGSGHLCDPCWRGQGTRAELALGDASAADREARRRYREKNRSMNAQYQRAYRERKRAQKERAREGNQVLYEAGPDTVHAVASP